jgi:hypothetical protein
MSVSKQVYNHSVDVDKLTAPYRTDVVRPSSKYDDLAKQVVVSYKTYESVEAHVSPLVSRNIDNSMFILTKDLIHERVQNGYRMNSFMYNRLLDAVEKFYLKNRHTNRLPSPHIISHRSIHYCDGMFEITKVDTEKYLQSTRNRVRNYKVNSVHMIEISGLDPLYIENMRGGDYKYLMLRPKLGKSGAPAMDRWEILLYLTNFGYNVTHIDTDKNPRYNGTI